jgi:hypothetical protein
MAGYFPGQLRRGNTIGQVRVVVTRIEHDGTMQRRMVDTARQSDPRNWEDLAARALAAQAPYRPVPGTAVYLIRVDGHTVEVCEYDLDGPLRDLVTVVLAIGSQMLAPPAARATGRPGVQPRQPRSRRAGPLARSARPGMRPHARLVVIIGHLCDRAETGGWGRPGPSKERGTSR